MSRFEVKKQLKEDANFCTELIVEWIGIIGADRNGIITNYTVVSNVEVSQGISHLIHHL